MLGRVILASWILTLSGCGAEDPDAALRQLIGRAEAAAEERNTGFFRDVIAESYSDARGNDRDRILDMLRGYFLTHPSIEVVTRIDSVILNGADAAHVVLHSGVVGRREGTPLVAGLDGQLYRVELELVSLAGEWQIIGAKWERPLE